MRWGRASAVAVAAATVLLSGPTLTAVASTGHGSISVAGAQHGSWRLTLGGQCRVNHFGAYLYGTHAASDGSVTYGYPVLIVDRIRAGASGKSVNLATDKAFKITYTGAGGEEWLAGWNKKHVGSGHLTISASFRNGKVKTTMKRVTGVIHRAIKVTAIWSCPAS
jgi:hypothetical protein